jgi:hypothetical protein
MSKDAQTWLIIFLLFGLLALVLYLLQKSKVVVRLSSGSEEIMQECQYRHPTTGARQTFLLPTSGGFCPAKRNVGGIDWVLI